MIMLCYNYHIIIIYYLIFEEITASICSTGTIELQILLPDQLALLTFLQWLPNFMKHLKWKLPIFSPKLLLLALLSLIIISHAGHSIRNHSTWVENSKWLQRRNKTHKWVIKTAVSNWEWWKLKTMASVIGDGHWSIPNNYYSSGMLANVATSFNFLQEPGNPDFLGAIS